MALKPKSSVQKGARKSSSKPTSSSAPSSKSKKKASGPRPPPTQQKTKPSNATGQKRKPPHLRYTEADLKLPALNGIRPAGVQKPPNRKKGKQFTDDASMRTILALVMAEKEGNIESKMMKARQMEEIREARRAEAEKRAEGKKEKFEERKEGLRKSQKKMKKGKDGPREGQGEVDRESEMAVPKKSKKRVSFG